MLQTDIKIVIGAGEYNNNPGWIHTQEKELNLLDDTTWKERFKPVSITAILAEHVWEHLTLEEGLAAARLCYKYLFCLLVIFAVLFLMDFSQMKSSLLVIFAVLFLMDFSQMKSIKTM